MFSELTLEILVLHSGILLIGVGIGYVICWKRYVEGRGNEEVELAAARADR
jgi:hypothetical protein